MWKLMRTKEEIGVELTESLAMKPAASVSGLYFAHPQSTYFAVGKINRDQVSVYLFIYCQIYLLQFHILIVNARCLKTFLLITRTQIKKVN